jgi:hypothetical protein
VAGLLRNTVHNDKEEGYGVLTGEQTNGLAFAYY